MTERAVVPQGSMPDVEIEVTDEEAAMGVAHIECQSCGGDGVVTWLPHKDEAPCVACSTRGTTPVMV